MLQRANKGSYIHHLALDLHAKVLDSGVGGDLGLDIHTILNSLHPVLQSKSLYFTQIVQY